jgi:hypothetical protein
MKKILIGIGIVFLIILAILLIPKDVGTNITFDGENVNIDGRAKLENDTVSISRGGVVKLQPIDKVETKWKNALDAFEDTLEHEQKVTSMINDLYALATEEKDYATQSMLKWFIDEQVEEEESAKDIIDKLKLIGDNGYGLYQLDKELAARVYTAPATAE